jgi:hypothetical protein
VDSRDLGRPGIPGSPPALAPGRGARRSAIAALLACALVLTLVGVPPAADGSSPAHSRAGSLAPGPTAEPSRLPASPFTGTEPAPMGLAYGGSSASGPLRTSEFVGNISLAGLRSYNSSLGPDAAWVSVQLNVYLEFTGPTGSPGFVYWVQDVMEVNTSSGAVEFFDNIWNATSVPYPVLYSSSVQGSGTITTYGPDSYYGYGVPCGVPGACATLAYPADVTLGIRATLGGADSPAVTFDFNDGHGVQSYDTAVFGFVRAPPQAPSLIVQSNLESASCPRCLGDAELVLGGPDDGYNTSLEAGTLGNLSLTYATANTLESVPAGIDYGASTGEGIQNATIALIAGPTGRPEAELAPGPGSLGPLWGPSKVGSVHVSVLTGTLGGTFEVNNSSAGTFSGDAYDQLLLAGSYYLSVTSGGTTYSLGEVRVGPGSFETLEVGEPPLVFEPEGLPSTALWGVTVDGRVLNGTGNLTFGASVGNHTFVVTSLAGYSTDPSSGKVNVSANGSVVLVRFSAVPVGPLAGLERFLLSNLIPIAAIALGLLLAGALVSGARARRRRRRARPGPPAPYSPTAPVGGASGVPAAAPGTSGYCPHCAQWRPFAYGSCMVCGWRGPPVRPGT